jgi:lysozyme
MPINPSQLKRLEILNEGVKTSVFNDSVGIPTVGIGHNLPGNSPDSITDLPGNPSYDDVLNGKTPLTNDQVDALYENDMNAAIANAQVLFPNWDSLPIGVQAALADMSFNLGPAKLAQFVQLQNAISVYDFASAADAMSNSAWANQVGERATRDIALMKIDEELLDLYMSIGDIVQDVIDQSPDFPADKPVAPPDDDDIDFTPDDDTTTDDDSTTDDGIGDTVMPE